jgi:DNA-binding CsgD family transcriptional regulator
MRRGSVERVERQVVALVHEGLGWSELSLQVGDALRPAVPFDHACWHTVDPSTFVFTGITKDSLEDELRLPHHEYAVTDVNQWTDLAKRRSPVGVLSVATDGDPERSGRFRELLQPLGIGDELRAAFVSRGACWGACGIYRNRDHGDFTADEAEVLARIAPHLADGFRRALMLGAANGGESGPGVTLFDATGAVEGMDPVAEKHLAGLVGGDPRAGVIAPVVAAVAERARRGGQGPPARARVRTADSGWLVLYGTRLGGDADRIAVLSEPAGPADLWPLVAAAYGLTDREREIAVACMRGHSTTEIATSLLLSPYTVQDHLTSMFDKVGVRSRRALVARIFYDHYWEPVLDGRSPDSRGRPCRGHSV